MTLIRRTSESASTRLRRSSVFPAYLAPITIGLALVGVSASAQESEKGVVKSRSVNRSTDRNERGEAVRQFDERGSAFARPDREPARKALPTPRFRLGESIRFETIFIRVVGDTPAESNGSKRIEAVPANDDAGETRTGFLADWTPERVDDDRIEVVARITRVVRVTKVGGRTETFDSRTAEARLEGEPALLKRLTERPYRLTLDRRCRLIDLAPITGDEQRSSVDAEVDSLAENQWRMIVRTLYSWLPDRPIATDDSWDRAETLEIGPIAVTRRSNLVCKSFDGSRLSVVGGIRLESSTADERLIDANRPTIKQVSLLEPANNLDEANQSAAAKTEKANDPDSPKTEPNERRPSIVERFRISARAPGSVKIEFDVDAGLLRSLDASINFDLIESGDQAAEPTRSEGANREVAPTLSRRFQSTVKYRLVESNARKVP